MPINIELPAYLGAILQGLVLFLGFYTVAIWLGMVIWTFRDVRARSRDIFYQLLATLLVLVFNVAGLFLYFILRPHETLAEVYARSLEEEALLQEVEDRRICPDCRRRVQEDFLVCPACGTELKKRCSECERLLHLNWEVCPYCGAAVRAEAEPGLPSFE